jgi:pimeloyl-ACP methyl ester carboxylesterase
VRVLLLHAGIADARMWSPQVEALRAAGHEPVTPDLPGFGQEPLVPPTVDHVAFAAERLAQPGAVVGCSFGGRVALELAGARPDLVERLVLVAPGLASTPWSDETRALFDEEERLLERGDLDGAARQQASMWLSAHAADEVRSLTAEMTRRSYELQLPFDEEVGVGWPEPSAESRLAELDVPTLLVVGDEDRLELREQCERLARELPDARLETIAGAGHLPGLERPEALTALLLRFLDDGVR